MDFPYYSGVVHNTIPPPKDDHVTQEEFDKAKERLKPVETAVNKAYMESLEKYCQAEPGTLEIVIFILQKSPYFLKAIYQLYHLFEDYKMDKDKKTTVLATVKVVLGIVALILGLFGKVLPPEVSDAIIGIAGSGYLLFSWLQGFFTNKTTAK